MPHHLLHPGSRDEWVARWGPVASPLLWSHGMYLILADELGITDEGRLMIIHRPYGIEHPYATSPDQRVPVLPLAGETVRLGVLAADADRDLRVGLRRTPDVTARRTAAATRPRWPAAKGTSPSRAGRVRWAATALVGRTPPVPSRVDYRYRFRAR